MIRRNRQIRKEEKLRAKRGFSDHDVYWMKDWFLRIVPKMLEELIKHNKGFPTSFEDDYYKENIQRAKDAGLMVGVYFFSQALD